jgi:hypothetical protein
VGKQAPSASSPHHVEDGVQELAGLVDAGAATGSCFGHERLEDGPLLVGKVGGIRSTGLHGELLGSWQGGA